MEALISFVLPLVILFALMYFMVIRPQRKQMEEAQNMLDNLTPGDMVATIGGLHGVIDEIDNQADLIVLDCEGVFLTFDLRAVSRVIDDTGVAQTIDAPVEDEVEEEMTDSQE